MPVIIEENESIYEEMVRRKSKISVEITFMDGPVYSKSKNMQNSIHGRLFCPN